MALAQSECYNFLHFFTDLPRYAKAGGLNTLQLFCLANI